MTIGIIGYGEFGRFLQALAKEHLPHAKVVVASRTRAEDGETFVSFEQVCKADILIPCVPISALEETLKRAKPLLGVKTIIVDIATVKEHPSRILKELGLRYIATHPMFGPFSLAKRGRSLEGLRLVVTGHTLEAGKYQSALEELRASGLNVIEMAADEHDKLVARTLFLTHLIAQAMVRGGFDRTPVDTVSFGYLMDAVESVRQHSALFKDVYTYNPHCKPVLDQFTASLGDITASLRA